MMRLIRYFHPSKGVRVGVDRDGHVYDLTHRFPNITSFLQASVNNVQGIFGELETLTSGSADFYTQSLYHQPNRHVAHWLAPSDGQDIWASGVTYERSREARQEEAIDGGDVYARVYDAERPELFFKAHGRDVIGTLGDVGIRADATWNVPEPELVVVLNPTMQVVGFSVGNDMSSRDIEGENPLYLPQAKFYTASCAIGEGIVLDSSHKWMPTNISIHIARNRKDVFAGQISTTKIKRSLQELIDYLGRSNKFPNGVMLLTGTGLVPPTEFTLQAGDVITITIDGIGTLINTVKVV